MIFDSHMHTEFSADSEMRADAALSAAKSKNLGCVFTEHFDPDCPKGLSFTFAPERYWQQYAPLRGEHLRLGVEIGMQAHTAGEAEAFLSRAPFDQVIGSLHVLYDIDLYNKGCYENRVREDIFRDYYQTMADAVRKHPFINVLGHIDYLARCIPYEPAGVCYEEFHDLVDAVLRACIETDTVLELNTRRLASTDAANDLLPVYQRYQELGGQYITIGSDAHNANAIGAHFSVALSLAEHLKLGVVTFKNRELEISHAN